MDRESGITGDHGRTETDGSEATSAGLVQVLMEQQQMAREQYQQAQEQQAAQQEVLIRLVEQQREEMARYRDEMQSARAEAAAATRPKLPKPTLQKLGDRDDIESFLSTFERIAKQQDWPKEVWAMQLAGLLTGKALAAYAAMVSTEALEYEKVKRAVLHRYDVNEETHRLRFRQEQKRPEESYRAWVCRSTDHFDKWMKDQEMSLREVIIMEQVLMGVPEDMAVWLKERKPKSLDELGTLADDYVLARRSEGVRPLRPTAPGLRQGPGKANTFVKEEQPRPGGEGSSLLRSVHDS